MSGVVVASSGLTIGMFFLGLAVGLIVGLMFTALFPLR
jgi:hypothetical protein